MSINREFFSLSNNILKTILISLDFFVKIKELKTFLFLKLYILQFCFFELFVNYCKNLKHLSQFIT